MNFHEARVDLICHVLNKGRAYYDLIKLGNGYGKILRNYHQINAKGEMVYRNRRALNHLVFSKDAADWIHAEGTMVKKPFHALHYEHSVPIKEITTKLEELLSNDKVFPEQVKAILDLTSLVAITKDEQKKIDDPETGFKDSMPDGWLATPVEMYDRFRKIPEPIELVYLENKL